MTGTLSTEDYSDVADKILQYINSTPPALVDCSGSTNDIGSSSAPPPQDHLTSPLLLSANKSLPQGLLSHLTMTSSSDHVIQPPLFSADHMTSKALSLPDPTSNHDKYVTVAMTTTCM